jgi:hypothetical protein
MNQALDTSSQSVYFVTYCVLNGDAGANPFGHSCLIFSKTDDSGRLQVEKIYGYYSQATTTTKPILKWLKSILGVKYDLQDTHAVLKEERIRDLIGDGLKGLSFSITDTQYQEFLTKMADKLRLQTEEMAALDRELQDLGLKPTGAARYQLQQAKSEVPAHQKLPPFHLRLGLTLKGFNTDGSTSCKQLALNHLEAQDIIGPVLRPKLECGSGFRQAFPRFSDMALAPIRFQVSGRYEEKISRTGKRFYNPTTENGNHLFWTLPTYTPSINNSN